MSGQVLLFGSSWLLRQGVKQTLKRLGLSVIGEGSGFEHASAECLPHASPTLVLSLAGPIDDLAACLDELRKAKACHPGVKLVLLADTEDAADLDAALHLGVDAVLSSKLSSRQLGNSLQLVLLEQKLFPNLAAANWGKRAIIREPTAPPQLHAKPVAVHEHPQPAPLPPQSISSQLIRLDQHAAARSQPSMGLVWTGQAAVRRPGAPSGREWQILKCLARGSSNKAIARDLGITETTVKVHIKSLLRKLNVGNRTQAAIWFLNNGKDTQAVAHEPLAATEG